MKKIFKKSIAVPFLISIYLIISCSTKEPTVLKIGVVGPMTGEGATYGAAMKRGINLALEEINEEGGLLDKKIKAIYEDSKLMPREGINALNKLINKDGVQVVIGAAASRVTLNMAPFAEKSKVVLISSISTADKLKEAGDYIFRNVPPNLQQGISAAKFVANKLKVSDAAVFYKNDEYGISLSEAFIDYFKKIGKEILIIESYQPDETDFRNQLIKISKFNPEVVFFPGNYEDTGKILRQAKELGMKSIFIGGDGSYSPELINIAGDAAEGSYYTVMSLPPNSDPIYSSFKKDYIDNYSQEPDVYSVYAYDAAMVIFQAIKSAGEYNGTKIKDELYDIEYNGITGKIEFDKYGEVKKEYAIYIVKNVEFVLYQ